MATRRVDVVPHLRVRRPPPSPPQPITEPGSAGSLRGIPVIARGVPGTAPGTAPHIAGVRNADRVKRDELGVEDDDLEAFDLG